MHVQINDTQKNPRPVIAILTMSDKKRPFRGNHRNFIDIIRAGRKHDALVYVATVKEIDTEQKNIHGYVYNFDEKVWSRAVLPLPDVIYNRIPSREDEMKSRVQTRMQTIMNHWEPQFFNPYFFNKWTLYEWLEKSNNTNIYVPDTQKLTSSRSIANILKQHSILYLKPESGKAGKGIMKVQRSKKNKRLPYVLTIQEKKISQKFRYPTIRLMWSRIKEYIADEDYILQQGIRLVRSNGSPFDLRVLVQKNSQGLWRITGIGARVAGRLSITTHVPRGGSIDDPLKLLNSAFGKSEGRQLLRRLRKAALLMTRQIERSCGHALGEMSMDLGVDTLGNIWFFEANSKPMKFDEPDIRKRSLDRIIQYSMYLAKQSNRFVSND